MSASIVSPLGKVTPVASLVCESMLILETGVLYWNVAPRVLAIDSREDITLWKPPMG
jgi:hypothetical protein